MIAGFHVRGIPLEIIFDRAVETIGVQFAAAHAEEIDHVGIRGGDAGRELGIGLLLIGRKFFRTRALVHIDEGGLSLEEGRPRRKRVDGRPRVSGPRCVGEGDGPAVGAVADLVIAAPIYLDGIVDAGEAIVGFGVARPLAPVDCHGQSMRYDLQVQGVLLGVADADSRAQVGGAVEAVVVVLLAGLQHAHPIIDVPRVQVEPGRAGLLRGRRLQFRPLGFALPFAAKHIDHCPGEAGIGGEFPTEARAGIQVLGHGRTGGFVRAGDIADAGEILSAHDGVELPPGLGERFWEFDRIGQTQGLVATERDVLFDGVHNAGRALELTVECRADVLNALAVAGADHDFGKPRDIERIGPGPFVEPVDPVCCNGIAAQSGGQLGDFGRAGVILIAQDAFRGHLHEIDIEELDHILAVFHPGHEAADRLRQFLVALDVVKKPVVVADGLHVIGVMPEEIGKSLARPAGLIASLELRNGGGRIEKIAHLDGGILERVADEQDGGVARIVRVAGGFPCVDPGQDGVAGGRFPVASADFPGDGYKCLSAIRFGRVGLDDPDAVILDGIRCGQRLAGLQVFHCVCQTKLFVDQQHAVKVRIAREDLLGSVKQGPRLVRGLFPDAEFGFEILHGFAVGPGPHAFGDHGDVDAGGRRI